MWVLPHDAEVVDDGETDDGEISSKSLKKKQSFRQHSRPSVHGGTTFYVNEDTGETTWTVPDDAEVVT